MNKAVFYLLLLFHLSFSGYSVAYEVKKKRADMKKWIAIILAGIMAFSLAACSGSSTSNFITWVNTCMGSI